jgi:hypothetical protein
MMIFVACMLILINLLGWAWLGGQRSSGVRFPGWRHQWLRQARRAILPWQSARWILIMQLFSVMSTPSVDAAKLQQLRISQRMLDG